jgi:pseudouridine synthase
VNRGDTESNGSGGVRLQRILAAAGVGARRACERMIEDGRVRVNGRIVKSLPAFVNPATDHVDVDGRPISVRKRPRPIYIMVNKPERVLTSTSDEPGVDRKTVMSLVDHPSAGRLFPVGRLDFLTAGLVLLTNDGALANRLTHPRYGVPKTYRAVVRGILDETALDRGRRGLLKELRKADRREGRVVPGDALGRLEMTIAGYEQESTVLRITVRDGKAGNIGAMLAGGGIQVKKLERTAIGPVELRAVARGQWRELDRNEVRALKKAGGRGVAPQESRP